MTVAVRPRRFSMPSPGAIAACASALVVALAVPPLARAETFTRVPGPDRDRVPAGFVDVEYGELVDLRRPTHSGEAVGAILERLEGRPVPTSDERRADRLDHMNLDPILEPYAFVLSDAIDQLGPAPDRAWIELGWLWAEGEAQPAWAELLRARRYVVESDGEGSLRLFLPIEADLAREAGGGAEAGERAFERAWPVLRHVLAAERRRLEAGRAREADDDDDDAPTPDPPVLRVASHAFVHEPAKTRFRLAVEPYRTVVRDTDPRDGRPPLDFERLEAFLESGLRVEGGRLDAGGDLEPFGSRADAPPKLLGEPITLADLAVAYRAVFHGGLAVPYMSLDPGYHPETAFVNYGGRLRDTRLGLVALLCDIRFKTFSLGVDVLTGRDEREAVRAVVPSFRTHLERYVAAASASGQQTRLWFYPDRVDLTLSPQADVLALRSARMSANAERVDGASPTEAVEVPPWTRELTAAIDRDYDRYARRFPELADLDEVVRWLAFFSWLRVAAEEGARLPDLDALLDVELPEFRTPRAFPQLLAYIAAPASGEGSETVSVLPRLDVHRALDRARTPGAPLDADRRAKRARDELDPRRDDHRRVVSAIDQAAFSGAGPYELDALAYRAERMTMHRAILDTLAPDRAERLAARYPARPAGLRVLSVAIGGLDLDMTRAVRRANRRSSSLVAGPARAAVGAYGRAIADAGPSSPRERSRSASVRRRSDVAVPAFDAGSSNSGADSRRRIAYRRAEVSDRERGPLELRVVVEPDGPGRRSRTARRLDASAPLRFGRIEPGIAVDYVFERFGDRLRARSEKGLVEPAPLPSPGEPDEGIVEVRLDGAPRASPASGLLSTSAPERDAVTVLLGGDGEPAAAAEVPRRYMRRLVRGPAVDPAPGVALLGFDPLPERFAGAERMLLRPGVGRTTAPRAGDERRLLAAEEDPIAVARALREWFAAPDRLGTPSVAIGVRADAAARWAQAPRPWKKPILVRVEAGLDRWISGLGSRIADAWGAGRVRDRLPRKVAGLVIVVSAEPPDLLAARLRALASDDRLEDRLLAVYALGGAIRPDFAADLVRSGRLSGFGYAEVPPHRHDALPDELETLSEALERKPRIDDVAALPGTLLWWF